MARRVRRVARKELGDKRGSPGKPQSPPSVPIPHRIVRRIVRDHHEALGYSADPKSWPRHLSIKGEISLGTARNLLGADNGRARKVSDKVLDALARHFSTLPQFGALTGSRLGNAKDLETFLAATSAATQQLRELPVTLRIRRRNSLDEIASELVGTYVAYHHAFESLSPEVRMSREVVHIERDGAHLPFRMSFKTGTSDQGQRVRFFHGEAMPLGKSAMCVGTATPFNNPDYDEWPSRSRSRPRLALPPQYRRGGKRAGQVRHSLQHPP